MKNRNVSSQALETAFRISFVLYFFEATIQSVPMIFKNFWCPFIIGRDLSFYLFSLDLNPIF